jgi:hypothetical protein
MEEQQGRGAAAVRSEKIKACTRRIPLTIRHGGGVVVGGVERLPIH